MKYLSFLVTILFLPLWGMSQKFIESEATQAYRNYSFNEVIKLNKVLVDEGNRSRIVLEELANAYFYNADYKLAGYYYDILFTEFDSLAVQDVYHYYQTLRVDGNDRQADQLVRHYCALSDGYRHQLAYLLTDRLVQKELTFSVRKIEYNSSHAEFVTGFYRPDRVFVASARDTSVFEYRVHRWNDKAFLDIFLADRDIQTGEIQKLKKLKRPVNSKYHESTIAFHPQTKTLYFTQNKRKRSTKKGEDILRLSICQTRERHDGKWQKPEVLPLCSDRFSVANPALSADGKRLYFASDMPGGFGNSDLYYVELVDEKVVGSPVNLGEKINTIGRETFPFIDSDSVLYFASDGRQGYGGLDVYEASPEPGGMYANPVNMGETINSTADDFAFIVNADGQAGYFASNRNNPGFDDDIYSFTVTPVEQCRLTFHGQLTDTRSGQQISGVAIHLRDKTMDKLIGQTVTNNEGEYDLAVDCAPSIQLSYEKSGYRSVDSTVLIQAGTTDLLMNVRLNELVRPAVNEKTMIADTMQFESVYFGFDQSVVTEAAVPELEKIIQVLHEYPELKIRLISYADRRGESDYNDQLSQKRSAAIAGYLTEHGAISSERIISLAGGEIKSPGSMQVTEKVHQENRRTDFKLIAE